MFLIAEWVRTAYDLYQLANEEDSDRSTGPSAWFTLANYRITVPALPRNKVFARADG
jgi:hypothetical protein